MKASWHLCIALGYMNSSLNPVLYAFLDENFKRCFRDFCLPCRTRVERNSLNRGRNANREPVSVCAPTEAGTEKKPVWLGMDQIPRGSRSRRVQQDLQSEITQISTTEFWQDKQWFSQSHTEESVKEDPKHTIVFLDLIIDIPTSEI